ncbi:MAG: YfhO family protein, partial [Clostridia bacterium]|nr:YfhO family protein [Clostridia bacterium]
MKKNRLMQAAARNKYSLLAFGASAFVMVIVYYCFNVIPFGDYTVLRMDLYHQYGPLFAELYDRIVEGKSLVYSWTSGLGSSFLGNFSNYLASPTAIFMLLLGHENMPEAIAL